MSFCSAAKSWVFNISCIHQALQEAALSIQPIRIPQAFVEELLGAEHWYSVPLATLIGIPMYADIFGTIPIAESLFAKGAGLGTVLSFMMGVTALSLPSMVMLRKAVKPRLLAVFFGVVVVGIMLIGFFFNAISVAF